MPQSKRVFLSYARSTSASAAGALHAALGAELAFLDTEDIETLEEFPRGLTDALLGSHLVVVFADERYFQRWYCLREWLLARAPWLAARKGGDARRALEHLIVVLPEGGLSADEQKRLPLEVTRQNLPSTADPDALAEIVRERLARSSRTLAQSFDLFGVSAATRELLTDPPIIPHAFPQRLGDNGNTADLRATLGDGFVGRADELWTLHDILCTQRGGAEAVAVTGALQGGGGFGKTRLAVEYVYRYGPSAYPGGLFWVDGSDPSLLSSSLRRVLASLMPGASVDEVPELEVRPRIRVELIRRAEQRGDALFVVDNLPEAPKGEAPKPLEHFCPAVGEVTCLVTTRVLQGRPLVTLPVQVLEREASIRLLSRDIDRGALHEQEWARIAEWVGHLPLALEILNRVLVQAGVTANELLELATTATEEAGVIDSKLEALHGQVPEKDLHGIAAAFQLSVTSLDEPARELALDCAWLAPAPIPQLLLKSCTPPATLDRARGALVGRSFLARADESASGVALQMHRVLASYLRAQGNGPDRAKRMWQVLLLHFRREEIDAAREDRELLSDLVPHVDWLFSREELRTSVDPSSCLELSNLLDTFGARLASTAALELAVRIARHFVVFDLKTTEAMAHVCLGMALRSLGEREDGPARLEEAVRAYRTALAVYTKERLPLPWAETQNNLGNVLWALGLREDGSSRLEEAVRAFRAALEVRTSERRPLEWAMTQNNLGGALSALGEREDSPARLEEAVRAFRAALEVCTKERLPLQWAVTQNNLGSALLLLGQREDGSARLEEAVRAFRAALEVRTKERLPLEWAETQNNLGSALAILGEREDSPARLEEAVRAFRAALEVNTKERLPLQWAITQNNLGNALWALGQREEGPARLEEAVRAYGAALEVSTKERLPLEWAMTQSNLGNALQVLGKREDDPAHLEEAVRACQAALEVHTKERLPLQWAMTQGNLANALSSLGEREDDPARLEEAVRAFRAALEVFDPHIPRYCEITSRDLARALDLLGRRSSRG